MTLKGREGDTFEGANLGSEIVVTHNLDKHDKGRTTGSYKINGQAASKAKVKLLAEYLNIQVDNPCVVLTQSVSSDFLRNAKNGENPNPNPNPNPDPKPKPDPSPGPDPEANPHPEQGSASSWVPSSLPSTW